MPDPFRQSLVFRRWNRKAEKDGKPERTLSVLAALPVSTVFPMGCGVGPGSATRAATATSESQVGLGDRTRSCRTSVPRRRGRLRRGCHRQQLRGPSELEALLRARRCGRRTSGGASNPAATKAWGQGHGRKLQSFRGLISLSPFLCYG